MSGSVEVGDLVTVLPHKMTGGWTCGRWNGRVRSRCRLADDLVWVQELKVRDGVWHLGMNATARIDHLVPIEVQVDLFGNPAPALAGGAR